MKVGWLDSSHGCGDKSHPWPYNCRLSSSAAHKQTRALTHTHSSGLLRRHRTRVTGTAFEEAHSTTTVGPTREQAALWGWVTIDSLLDYSEALVMNLLHVLVLFSSVWIGLSVSSIDSVVCSCQMCGSSKKSAKVLGNVGAQQYCTVVFGPCERGWRS